MRGLKCRINHRRETKQKEDKQPTPITNPVWHSGLLWCQRKNEGTAFYGPWQCGIWNKYLLTDSLTIYKPS